MVRPEGKDGDGNLGDTAAASTLLPVMTSWGRKSRKSSRDVFFLNFLSGLNTTHMLIYLSCSPTDHAAPPRYLGERSSSRGRARLFLAWRESGELTNCECKLILMFC